MGIFILLIMGLILVGATLWGYYRGFLKMALSMLSLVISIFLVSFLQPYVYQGLMRFTPLHDTAKSFVYERMEDAALGETDGEKEDSETYSPMEERVNWLELGTLSPEEQQQWLKESDIPSQIQEKIDQKKEQAARTFITAVSDYVADTVVNAMSFLLTFVLVFVLVRVLFVVFEILDKLPVVRGVNRSLGALLGFLEGLFIVWLLFLIITAFLPSGWGSQMMSAVEGNPVLAFLYNCIIGFLIK